MIFNFHSKIDSPKISYLYRHLYLRSHQNIWPLKKQIYHVICSVLCSLVFAEQFPIQLLVSQLYYCLDISFRRIQPIRGRSSLDQWEGENSQTILNPNQQHVLEIVEFLNDVLPSKHQETKKSLLYVRIELETFVTKIKKNETNSLKF